MLSSLFYANSEPQPNAKYSCAASVAIARKNSRSVFYLVWCARRAHVLKGESPDPARQWEGDSRTARVSTARWNLKEAVSKPLG